MNQLCFMSGLTSAEWAAWAQAAGGALQALAAGLAVAVAFKIANDQYVRELRHRLEQEAAAQRRVVQSAMHFCECVHAFLLSTRTAETVGLMVRGAPLIEEILKWPQQIAFDQLSAPGALLLLRMRIAAAGALSIIARAQMTNLTNAGDQQWLSGLIDEAAGIKGEFRNLYAEMLAGWEHVGRPRHNASQAMNSDSAQASTT